LRLEVKYPDKPAHEVEVKVTMVVLGRDPSCDIVINDERCSRRHAVIEMTPTGLQVRDSGSANGIFVNGKKMERSPLAQGDLVRLGEVIIKVLPEEQPGTLVMATDEIVDLGPAPAVPAKAAGPSALDGDAPARRPAQRPLTRTPSGAAAPRPVSGEMAARPDPRRAPAPPLVPPTRPLTVSVLAGLWLVSVVFYAAAALGAAPFLGLNGVAAAAAIAFSALLAFVSALMAYGLFTLRPWARPLQAVIAGLGLLVCPFTLASATTLIYALRPGTRAVFGDARAGAVGAAESAELTFALTLIGTVILGSALCLTGGLFARFAR
jgi:hypothetical protein